MLGRLRVEQNAAKASKWAKLARQEAVAVGTGLPRCC
jgi:hypothetical protein